MKARKARHWWLVETRHGVVEEVNTMLSAAKANKRRLDEAYPIHAPFRIVKAVEELPRRKGKK